MSAPNGGATPRRTTRAASVRQQTPLPALETIQSHAYGARGKTQLNAQITTNTADIDAAFTTNARKSRAPTAKEQTPARTTAVRPRKNKQRAEEPESGPEEEPEDRPNGIKSGAGEDRFRPATRLDSSLSYGLIPEVRKSAAAPKGPSPSRAPPAEPSPVSPVEKAEVVPEEYEPPRWKVFLRTLKTSVASGTQIPAFIGLVFFCILVWMTLPLAEGGRAYVARENFVIGCKVAVGMSPYDQPPSQIERSWYEYKHLQFVKEQLPNFTYPEMQWQINQNVYDRLANAEHAARLLKGTVGLHSESIAEIQRVLPPKMAMTIKDGQWYFEDEFLQAFAEKAISSNATAPLWDKLMASNEERLDQVHKGNMQTMVNGVLAEMKVVTQEQLKQAIIDNNDYMEKHFNDTLASFRSLIMRDVRDIAEEVTNVALEKSHSTLPSKAQLGSLAYAMLIENTNRRMREVNYFSVGLGAVVVPLYTSPTFKNPVLAQGWYEWFMYRTGLKTRPSLPFVPTLPPTAALRDWKEGAECWCAAPSNDEKGLAQLTVQYPHKIYPDGIYIEHVPASGTRDIAAAPKSFEVWARMDNATEAVHMQEVLDREVNIRHGFECGLPPEHNSARWVCLSSGEYNIHYSNYIQRTEMLFDAKQIGLATNMIAFRVKENWGSEDHTCIYRLRLTGESVEKEA